MREIRVRYTKGLHGDDELGRAKDGGMWFPDLPANRRDLMIIVDAGNEHMGQASHWLEEREA